MTNLNSYNNIPIEIWYKIIQHLSQKELLECQRVCKSWHLSTYQYFWKNVELRTTNHIDLFLNSFPKDVNKFVKNIVIGDQYSLRKPSVEYILSKEQLRELLLNLPNLEKIYVIVLFTKSIITELSNEEFLMEFHENCSNIQSFRAFGPFIDNHEEYGKILYSLRNAITDIIITATERNTYQHITSFTQLEQLTMNWIFGSFLELLYKIKMLTQLKRIDFNLFLNFENNIGDDVEMDIRGVLKIIEKDQKLKERLSSLEKLRLMFDDTDNRDYLYYTSIIMQYFTGLKEIDLTYDQKPHSNSIITRFFSTEWANFIFSHDKYKLEIVIYDIYDYTDFVDMCLKNNFIQNPANNKSVTKHLWLELDCSAYNKVDSDAYYFIFEYGRDFSLQFESKEINDNQVLKLAKIYLLDSENTLNPIYNVLNSEKSIMEDINTLTFEFTDEATRHCDMIDSEKRYLITCKTFQLIDQILSLATSVLKKK